MKEIPIGGPKNQAALLEEAVGVGLLLLAVEPPVEAPELEVEPDSEPPPDSPARFFFPFFLKSVSYQPPPLRRNPAALTLRRSSGFPQPGQSRRGSSAIFCSFSSWCWQAWHWYS
jgi:hypothetical protein